MPLNAADVKARISLRELFERDGHKLKVSNAALVCRSPFGQEKTPSCYVHEKEGYFKCFSTGIGGDCFTYYKETRKCDFPEALEELAKYAGMAPGQTPAPVRVVRTAVVEELAPPISGEHLETWEAGVAALRANTEEQERIADWRGYKLETVRWAVENKKLGLVPVFGMRR